MFMQFKNMDCESISRYESAVVVCICLTRTQRQTKNRKPHDSFIGKVKYIVMVPWQSYDFTCCEYFA